MFQRIRDLPDQGLYGVIGVLAVAALYVIGFVIKNSKNVSVDFVLFSAGVPLITLMVVMLLFGALLGVALTLVLARRRRGPKAPRTCGARRRTAQPPPVAPPPVTPPPPSSTAAAAAPGRLNLDLESRSRLRAHRPADEPRDRLARGGVDLVRPARADAEIAQHAVGQAVDDPVHVERRCRDPTPPARSSCGRRS